MINIILKKVIQKIIFYYFCGEGLFFDLFLKVYIAMLEMFFKTVPVSIRTKKQYLNIRARTCSKSVIFFSKNFLYISL